MSEFVGTPGAWQLHCTLSLASCRLRAETLARRLHTKLWAPGRYENVGPAVEGFYERTALEDEEVAGSAAGAAAHPRSKPRYGAGFVNSWKDSSGAMLATAMATSSSLDDEEFYDPEGNFSSPPSPAEDSDIIVNAPVSLQAIGMIPLREDDEDDEQTTMLRSKRNSSKIVTNNNEELYEKLAQIAQSLSLSAEDDVRCPRKEPRLDECDSGISSNGMFHGEAIVQEPKPVNGDIFHDSDEDTPPTMVLGKFSVTPVLAEVVLAEAVLAEAPEVIVEKSADEPQDTKESITAVQIESFKATLSVESVCLSMSSTSSTSSSSKDEDEYECDRKVLLRSTSLKSGKTPPGTPRRKKIVRFADALGLDLEAVRHIVSDDLPIIPASAFTYLRLPKSDSGVTLTNLTPVHVPLDSRVLYPQFTQPVTDPYFMERVRNQKVCLENIVINGLSLYGVVRVLNVCFEKSVIVRYTMDNWHNCYEVPANYIPGSNDGFSDRFRFTLYQSGLGHGQQVTFAVRYLAEGIEFWDNNYGVNYILKCNSTLPEVRPASETAEGPSWMYGYM